VDEPLGAAGGGCLESAPSGTATAVSVGSCESETDREDDLESLSRPVAFAVCDVDTRSGSAVVGPTVQPARVGLDGSRYLRGWGLTPQKPVRRAYEQNPALIRTWLETEYPARGSKVPTSVPQRARRRHAYIVFVDEAGFMLNSLLRRTWAPRGQTPVIKVSEPHGRISVIAAITISPVRRHFGFYFYLLADGANFHGYSVARFVEDVHHRIGNSITLVWDSIPIHNARPVRDYLAAHRRIVVEPFPPYAPELNPVDNAWGYVKYNRLANYTPHNLDELRRRIMAEFRRLQKRPDLLQAFFKRTGLGLGP